MNKYLAEATQADEETQALDPVLRARGEPAVALEVSPLFALDAEEFARRVDRNTRIVGPTYFS